VHIESGQLGMDLKTVQRIARRAAPVTVGLEDGERISHGRERGLSVRRVCKLCSVAQSALSYQGRKAANEALVVARRLALRDQNIDLPQLRSRAMRSKSGIPGLWARRAVQHRR